LAATAVYTGVVVATVSVEVAPYSLDDPAADHEEAAIRRDEDGDLSGAIASFRAATRHDPATATNWFNLGTLLTDVENPSFFVKNEGEEKGNLDSLMEGIEALRRSVQVPTADQNHRQRLVRDACP
jgi:hypothetical protein